MQTNGVRLLPKLKRTTRGLDVIQSVYAFAAALGLTDVFIGSKAFIDDVFFGSSAPDGAKVMLMTLLFVDILLLGLRFFWVPRNLVALIHHAAECRKRQEPLGGDGNIDLSSLSFAFHLVVIFLHGMLFYIICQEYVYISFISSSSVPLNGALFSSFVTMQACLLLINAAWIGLIKFQEGVIEARSKLDGQGSPDDEVSSPGGVWWLNNLICALVALAPFAVMGSCHSLLAACSERSFDLSAATLDLTPASPHQISALFELATNLFSAMNWQSSDPALIWALVVFGANSAIDLGMTGRGYLFFDDVEWEHEAPAAKTGGAV